MIPRIITDTTVTVHLDGEILVANRSHPAFDQIRDAAKSQDWDKVRELIDVGKAIEVWSDNEFRIEDNAIYYNGERVPPVLEKRILAFLEEDAPFEHLLAFYRRLVQNPSRRSIQELYAFLEYGNIPIGEDGCFYAYKSVRNDWMDHHSGKCFNGIGTTLSMPRNHVDDDANRGCSYGYHVGTLQYASTFGGAGSRLLIVRVDPSNVVSVPYDCQHQKVRTAAYTVVQEYTGPLPETYWTPSMGYDDGYFPGDGLDSDEEARLQDEIASCEDQLERLQTALDAAEDAGVTEANVINGLLNAIADVERQLAQYEAELDSLGEDDLYEG